MQEEKIYDMLLKESEVTWQDILHNLVKEEKIKSLINSFWFP